jgi:predicted 2-oxoglutarate/Fe(II)-dependent dioxygenase YbiX
MTGYIQLLPGDPAPGFRQRSGANPQFNFDSAAGRYLLLCFLGSASDAHAQAALAAMAALPDIFDDQTAAAFYVTNDPADESARRLGDRIPGHRVFWDSDLTVSRLYGAAPQNPTVAPAILRRWVLVDPMLRVRAMIPFRPDRSDIAELTDLLCALPPPAEHAGFAMPPPVLILPQVFEPDICARLIDLYDTNGGEESGFMREIDGKTVPVHGHSHKRRRDCIVDDPAFKDQLRARIARRVLPEIRKVHNFAVTRMERYLIGCYSAEEGGHFRAHRDNTTSGTAHRRFAVSINLNADFDGGEVSFPEYGPQSFKPPPGGAVVFSCSLLHAVSQVTRGRRYAFLPFLYDDAAARLREENNRFLDERVTAYRG